MPDQPAPTAAPDPAPVLIVCAPRNRWWLGTSDWVHLFGPGVRPNARLINARRLYIWPHKLGLAGLAMAADTEPRDQLQLGPIVPAIWLRDIETVVWTTSAAGAALLAHPARQRPAPAPAPLKVEVHVPGGSEAAAQVSKALAAIVPTKTSGPGLPTRRIPTPAEVFRA